MKDAFEAFDLNKDGYLGKDELRVCLAMTGRPVREEVLDMMIKIGDADADSRVSFSDFRYLFRAPRDRLQFVMKNENKLPESPSQLIHNKSPHHQTVTRKIDSPIDLSGLDPSSRRLKTIEIVHLLLGVDSIRPRDIKALDRKFIELDTKKLGKLDLFQFEKIFDKYQSIDNRKLKSNHISLLFNFCDSDNSNSIDAKEFLIVLCWLSEFGNLDKLRFAFQLFDLNGNGRMDRNELLQLVISVNLGSLQHRQKLEERVNSIFKAISVTSTGWETYELSFEQLVSVADKNPDLFDSVAVKTKL
jgi:Ca2+-binding EF-hand superfamily protein